MNPTTRYTGGSPIYERDGRHFVNAGIGTAGWGVFDCWREVDFSGAPIGDGSWPEHWLFPDPAKVAAQKEREEAERQRLEKASLFPLDGISGEYHQDSLTIWPSNGESDEALTFRPNTCTFCGEMGLVLWVSDDCSERSICRDCLGRIFDVFEARLLTHGNVAIVGDDEGTP